LSSRLPDHVRDQRIERVEPLASPAGILDDLPLTAEGTNVVLRGREQIHAILDREDDRLLVIVGPCSVHDADAALDYARLLAGKAAELGDDLCVAMRVYFEKPRTTTGWKGMVNDPHLDGSGDVNEGLHRARRLLLEIHELGLPVGCEFLDPITPQYISDAVSWGAIGARTTESQIHRQLGSGLSMPVGFKNSTDGNVQPAIDAVVVAASEHWFPGVTKQGVSAIFHTTGNRTCHVILRGGSKTGPNYEPAHVEAVSARLSERGCRSTLMIDCSHGNSLKDHHKQREVAACIAEQVARGSWRVFGAMIESHLVEGRQDLAPGSPPRYGQSITDACLSLSDTERLLEQLARAQQARGPLS
jgi:3-deoxy-7-phosphoheptulonate synthase